MGKDLPQLLRNAGACMHCADAAPVLGDHPELIEQLAIAGIPIEISNDRSLRFDAIQKGADQRIRTVQQRPLRHGARHGS